jgi:uncharacterized protein YqeY
MPLSYLQKEKINAMKNKDVRRKNVLSEIIDTCQKATITPRGRLDLTAELVNESLIKYQKMVQEMIDTCPATRTDLLDEYKANMEIVNEYAPKLITDEKEIEMFIRGLDFDLVPASRSSIMKELKGKADMKIANKVLGEMLK